MAINKNALIRYRTIDKCLQNSMREWTLNDLVNACSDALYEYEGRQINVSVRTLQADIQLMRSDKLGYNAPIEVYDKKFYQYADADYSITNIPLTESDMNVLSETMDMLRQFQDFSLFKEFKGIFNKLEDKIHTERTNKRAIIHLDKNAQLTGLEYLDELYQAILKEVVLKILYQSFKASTPAVITMHPYFLKEYNNRWFIVGKKHDSTVILTLALDRILGIDYDFNIPYKPSTMDANDYYKDTIGVTVLTRNKPELTKFKINRENAPYVQTKPFHQSQQLIETCNDGSQIFTICVHLNFELERLLLGFGNSIEVLAPNRLRRTIKRKLKLANQLYNNS